MRGEVVELDRVVQRTLRVWPRARTSLPDQDAFVDSVALNLHSFYSGLERLFELIARHVDRALPTGETWHRDLVQQMARDVTDARPAVISQANAQTLDEFRRFRHLVLNVYTMNLVPARMSDLIAALPDLWMRLRAELLAFADFMEEVAQADSDQGA